MKNEYYRAIVVTMAPLGFFMLAMSWALEFAFDDHVAGLLAASATCSLPIFLSSQDHISLPYRRAFFGGSCFGLFMIVLNVAYLIVGAKSHLFVPIAVVVLILPELAIIALLERILFTDEERLEIQSRTSQKTRVV
jgi:hypothetical protein